MRSFFLAPRLGGKLMLLHEGLLQERYLLLPSEKEKLLQVSEQDLKFFRSKIRWVNRSRFRLKCDYRAFNPQGFLFAKNGEGLPVPDVVLFKYEVTPDRGGEISMDDEDASLVRLALVEIKTGKGPAPFPGICR